MLASLNHINTLNSYAGFKANGEFIVIEKPQAYSENSYGFTVKTKNAESIETGEKIAC